MGYLDELIEDSKEVETKEGESKLVKKIEKKLEEIQEKKD